MTNNQSSTSSHLSFSQRHGYAPLPEPMQLGEVSEDLRREIWNVVREMLLEGSHFDMSFVSEEKKRFIERVLGQIEKKACDEISTEYKKAMLEIKSALLGGGSFNAVLDLVEIIVNDRDITKDFVERIKSWFGKYAAAYQLDTTQHPYLFSPQSSKEQGEATQQAIETLHESNMSGATAHLRQAAEHINVQQYADAITDSIHAVESVARMITPQAKTLGSALKHLEKEGLLTNQVLKKALEKLYGYTNDGQGIRHALLDQESPDAGLDEAIFMYGACASFAAYLARKHQQSEQQEVNIQ